MFSTLRISSILGLLLGCALSLFPVQNSWAENNTGPIDNPIGGVTADVLPTAQVNGVVWDQAIVGNTVYVAGEFSSARPAGAELGEQEVHRNNLMSYNLITGEMTNWTPTVNGRIRAISASPDGKRIYIGGSFNWVNGQPRSRLAAFDTKNGELVKDFSPAVGSDVLAIAATNDKVYLGGWFTSINGVPRQRLAALSASGEILSWGPSANYPVRALAISENKDRIIVAGGFTELNGESSQAIGLLDAVTGTSYPFAASGIFTNHGVDAGLGSLKIFGNQVITTGYAAGRGDFEGVASIDISTGRIDNLIDCQGNAHDATVLNNIIYVVSNSNYCAHTGNRTKKDIGYQTSAFTLKPLTKIAKREKGKYHNWEGYPTGAIVNWWNDFQSGYASGKTGWTVESAGEYLAIGGEFLSVNGVKQQGLVRFGTHKLVKHPRTGPVLPENRLQLVANRDQIEGKFKATWDSDNQLLHYKVIRADQGEPIVRLTAKSTPWYQPELKFTDTAISPGREYNYYVVAIDPDGNWKNIAQASVITKAAEKPGNKNPKAVFGFKAKHLQVSFDARASEDPDGRVDHWLWDFGDGTKGSGETLIHHYAKAGEYQVKLAVHDGRDGIDYMVRKVKVSSPIVADGTIAQDNFQRDQDNWGQAYFGGSWSNSKSRYHKVVGDNAVIELPEPGLGAETRLTGLVVKDISIRSDVKLLRMPTGGPYLHQLLARAGGDNYYKMVTDFQPDGSLEIRISEMTKNSEKIIGVANKPAGTYQANKKLEIRFDLVGKAPAKLSGKVWFGAEPAKFDIVAKSKSKAMPADGEVGIFAYNSRKMTSLPMTINIDNYRVIDLEK